MCQHPSSPHEFILTVNRLPHLGQRALYGFGLGLCIIPESLCGNAIAVLVHQ